jgi:hypothetical protein
MKPDESLDRRAEPTGRDASDVIDGEIGSARLREPSEDPEMGADLTELPEISNGPSEGSQADRDARRGSV